MKKSDFYYRLPSHLIAQKPVDPRSSSRMLCLDRINGQVTDKSFNEFADQFNAGDLVVFNDTKVIPARLYGHKTSGGKVEILIERILNSHRATAHVRASKSPQIGAGIELAGGFFCSVSGRDGALFELEFPQDTPLETVLTQVGHIPLPPYITRADEAEDETRYQTVFAQHAGAVAAPTAGLHFDHEMVQALETRGIRQTYVTLHVGSGTFQPVRCENLRDHLMHKERYAVSPQTVAAIEQTRARGGRVVAVGTTAVRALESAARSGNLVAGTGDTDLFITPGYRFHCIDALLTNFHLPESTLLMLVSAFAGYDSVMRAYGHAIERQYRFFSYGDAMLIS